MIVKKYRIKINNFIKKILYQLINFLILINRSNKSKISFTNAIVVIKIDGIGDYLLFRNFLEYIYKSQRYNNQKKILMIEKNLESFVKKYDRNFYDDLIVIDKKKFIYNLYYRYKFLLRLRFKKFNYALIPHRSFDSFYLGEIIKNINSLKITSFNSNLSNISLIDKKKLDCYIDEFYTVSKDYLFEFEANKNFIKKILKEEIKIKKPFIQNYKSKKNNIAILYFGGSHNYKKWDIDNYIRVAEYLDKHLKYDVYLVSYMERNQIIEKIKYMTKNKYKIFAKDEMKLVNLVDFISQSKLVISNDTSCFHIASILNIETYVLYAGIHFGRFLPYPKIYNLNSNVVLNPYIEKNYNQYLEESNNDNYVPKLKINDIKYERLLQYINKKII